MIQRYQQIKEYIKKCLEDLNEGQKFFTRFDTTLKDLAEALTPVQAAVVEFSKHHSNILIADTTIKYVVYRLRLLKSTLASDLCEAIIRRYNQRRKDEEVSLLELLIKKEYPEHSDDFSNVTKTVIKRTAVNLMKRLYPVPENEGREEDVEAVAAPLSLADGITQGMKAKEKPVNGDLDKDFKLLEETHEVSSLLENSRMALLSIPPTSTICEQAFPVAGGFKNKRRNRLGVMRINALMWLNRYFKVPVPVKHPRMNSRVDEINTA